MPRPSSIIGNQQDNCLGIDCACHPLESFIIALGDSAKKAKSQGMARSATTGGGTRLLSWERGHPDRQLESFTRIVANNFVANNFAVNY